MEDDGHEHHQLLSGPSARPSDLHDGEPDQAEVKKARGIGGQRRAEDPPAPLASDA
jgi:hypothetical protein